MAQDSISLRQLLTLTFAALLSPALQVLPGQTARQGGIAGWLAAAALLSQAAPGLFSAAYQVLAVGVPTVIEAATLAADLLESGRAAAPEAWAAGENAVVTPKDIDGQIRRLGRLVGLGINLALQPALDAEDLAALLG